MNLLISLFSALFLLLPIFLFAMWLHAEFTGKKVLIRVSLGLAVIIITALFSVGLVSKSLYGKIGYYEHIVSEVKIAAKNGDLDKIKEIIHKQ